MYTIKNWEEYTYYLSIYLKDGMIAKFRSDFFQLHPNNQLHFYTMLDDFDRQIFYKFIKPNEFSAIFSKLEFPSQQSVVKKLDEVYVAAMIDQLRTDEVVSFLNKLGEEEKKYYLELLGEHKAQRINTLLAYKSNTAGAMMTTEFVTAFENETVGTILEQLKVLGRDAETIYYIYIVTNANKLIGVVSLRDLIVSPRDHTMKFIMKEHIIAVEPSMDQKDVVTIVKDYDLLLVPVVSVNNELIGIVTVDDVMDVNNGDQNSIGRILHPSIRKHSPLLIVLLSGFILILIIASTQFSLDMATLIPYLVNKLKVFSENAVVPINTIVTSILCCFVMVTMLPFI